MSSLFIQSILLFSLSLFAAGNSSADSNASRGDAESSYSLEKIEEINYAVNTIKFQHMIYHYTPSTLNRLITSEDD